MKRVTTRTYTAYIEFDPETEYYVGTLPGFVGARSQGRTLDELHENLREVLHLILDECKARGEPIETNPFVGLQQVTVEV